MNGDLVKTTKNYISVITFLCGETRYLPGIADRNDCRINIILQNNFPSEKNKILYLLAIRERALRKFHTLLKKSEFFVRVTRLRASPRHGGAG